MLKIRINKEDMEWKERLIKEAEVLRSRIYLLQLFLSGDKFDDFSFRIKYCMRRQLQAMEKYYKHLKKRMELMEVPTDSLLIEMTEESARHCIECCKKEKNKKSTKTIEAKEKNPIKTVKDDKTKKG